MLPDVSRCFEIRSTLVYFTKIGKFCSIFDFYVVKKLGKNMNFQSPYEMLPDVPRCFEIRSTLFYFTKMSMSGSYWIQYILQLSFKCSAITSVTYWTGIYPNFPFGFVFWQHVIGEMWGNVHTAKSTKMF